MRVRIGILIAVVGGLVRSSLWSPPQLRVSFFTRSCNAMKLSAVYAGENRTKVIFKLAEIKIGKKE